MGEACMQAEGIGSTSTGGGEHSIHMNTSEAARDQPQMAASAMCHTPSLLFCHCIAPYPLPLPSLVARRLHTCMNVCHGPLQTTCADSATRQLA